MRRIPIRVKLAAALTVPLLGLFLLTVVEVISTSHEVHSVRVQTDLARASIGPEGVLSTLQNERTWAAIQLIGSESLVTVPVAGYDETRAQTDAAASAFRETLADEDRDVREAYASALDGLSALREIRDDIDASSPDRTLANTAFADEIFGRYTQLITPFFEANDRVAVAVDDADLRQITLLTGGVSRQVETIANLTRRVILDIVGGGIDQPSEIATAAELKAAFDATNAQILATEGRYARLVEEHFPHDMVDAFSAQVQAAILGQTVDVPSMLGSLDRPNAENLVGFRDVMVDALNARADDLNNAASGRERIFVGMAIATLAAALALTWLVSRSITRPLRSLTRQAKEMAERRLPDAVRDILDTPLGEDVSVPTVDPVRVTTRDEVADVADALNTVQDTALDLAIEQAVLRRNIADSFVNLGRRNQNLLGRQLDFITELESHETDPQSLANLFRLDHLATRMRRNAESLLVLAGIDPPRKWAAPVRVSDVIRAALGEVENYQRVAVRGVEPATIIGSAAADLAHLLAELIENALVFSPPDQTVEVRGHNRTDGPLGRSGYTLAVLDTGLGMPRADLAAANRRLAGAESFTIAPSKYLGHYVAGNLAARHGIRVHLDDTPGNGVTATITLPTSMLTTDEVTSPPVTPPHGHRPVPPPSPPNRPADRPAVGPGASPGGAGPRPLGPGTGPTPTIPPGAPFVPRPMETPAHGTPAVAAAGPPPAGDPPADPAAPSQAPPVAPGGPVPGRPARPAASPAGFPAAGGSPSAGAAGRPERLWPARLPAVTRTGEQPADRGGAAAGDAGSVPDGSAAAGPPPVPGLARRQTGPATGRPAAATPALDEALIATWERHRRTGTGPAGPAPGVPPGPTGRPSDELTRRVRGAQLPWTGVVPLRGDPHGRGAVPERRPTAPAPGRASEVQALLTDFTAGVQRGLAEARRARHGGVTAGANGHSGS